MKQTSPSLQLWGGIESTVNRVGDQYFDQVQWSGHAVRGDDVERIAALGIRTLRYPVLWERISPDSPTQHDWRWSDDRLARLREWEIRPIVGLVHHGSGPRWTNLLDPGFAEGLAHFAQCVAERYPWVDCYTPVNEPLTTARFSLLYGHWYPHLKNDVAFMRGLLTQCRGVVLAMRAIRAVQPDAKLVQTEDLGKTHSTQTLRYQADFENERRWLTFDLLCGRVDRHHAQGAFFLYLGIPESEWRWFADNPCPPDVVGINHYLTSERFLDERLERYPAWTHGDNGRHAYADVEAVRVCSLTGPEGLLREAWQRYHLPLAVTEVHLGCTREEQMRWLWQVWRAAQRLRQEDVEIRAVTAWALLGTYDWNSLVTRSCGHYEPGIFDVRGPQPRPTGLARLVQTLAAGEVPDHPVLHVPGWWQREERLCYPAGFSQLPTPSPRQNREGAGRGPGEAQPILLVGAMEVLGRAFQRGCEERGLPFRLLGLRDIETGLLEFAPWAVIHTGGDTQPDRAETDPETCRQEHVVGPMGLAVACARQRLPLLTFSSDLVFDGGQQRPYHESDPTNPLSVYGRCQAEAEREVSRLWPATLIVRTGPLFGSPAERTFLDEVVHPLEQGHPLTVANDLMVSPTYVPDLVQASLDLLMDDEHGVWHLANQGAVTWLALAQAAACEIGLDPRRIEGRPAQAFGWAAPRPAYRVLGSERGLLLPSLDDARRRYLRDR